MRYRLPLMLCLALLGWFTLVQISTGQVQRSVAVLEVKGAIGPATTDYLVRGMERAAADGAEAVIILMDTPGGLDAATRDINQAILASPVPVVTYVSPEGARAASAGTYILYASHVAAMAPATNLGAATPVNIMGGQQPGGKPRTKPADSETEDGEDTESTPEPAAAEPDNATSRKAINDSVAYIRGLAEKRGRNADWAEKAVREAASLSASAALEIGVIDLMADSLTDLLQALDGREVEVRGETITLATADAAINRIEPDWRNRLLSKITDPTVAYLLFIVGLYGLLLEGYNPGVLVPGIVGAISLIMALYAFQVLPINYAGVALIVLGLVLMVAEAFAPSFGALGIGGIIALVIGSLIMVDTDLPGFGVSRSLIGGIAVTSGLAFLAVTIALVKARSRPLAIGKDTIIGAVTTVMDPSGRVHVEGEDWTTDIGSTLAEGQPVRVVGIEGVTLNIEKIEQGD
ncbi:MAG: nodulation protein NfeD [Xanthomonadales bacterium]|nr:nodulation protein NfeD [Xanthomonadales bacterium]